MSSWAALKQGFDAFTRHLPVLLGAWLVIVCVQQAVALFIPDRLAVVEACVTVCLLAPLYAGQYLLAVKAVRNERCTFPLLFAGLRRWNVVVLAYVATGCLTALGLVAFIVPGILIALVYSFTQLCLLDGSEHPLSVIQAMRESVRLTRGYRVTILGIGLLLAIPYTVLSALWVMQSLNPVVSPWIVEVVALLSGTLFLGPVQATSVAVVYVHAQRQSQLRALTPSSG